MGSVVSTAVKLRLAGGAVKRSGTPKATCQLKCRVLRSCGHHTTTRLSRAAFLRQLDPVPPSTAKMMMLRSSVKPTVAAKASSRRQIQVQAVSRDSDSSMGQKLATGALAAVVAAGALLPAPVMAADLALGKQVFEGNCAACHAGGGNSVIPDHTLQKAAIEQFLTGGLTLEAITYQVENGKGAMPAWEGTLDDDEIQAVSAYVYDQATGNKW